MSGKSFPRSARLLAKADFDALFRAGQSVGSSFFRALVLPSKTINVRLGITVPKRIVVYAHDRNRIKRLLREAFRIRRSELPMIDLVILARNGILSASDEMLRNDINQIFNRVAQLKLSNPPIINDGQSNNAISSTADVGMAAPVACTLPGLNHE